jgi:hypothetical protein
METPTQPRDWFLGAIEAQGNVHHCLQAVIEELANKLQFVAALQHSLHQSSGDRSDHLSQLGNQLRLLGQTFQVRLGLLSPERELAWFRKSMARTGGPFASQIYCDPVFLPYDLSKIDQVVHTLSAAYTNRSKLDACDPIWQKSKEIRSPDDTCLWMRLLTLNAQLDSYCKVSVGTGSFRPFRLDKIPEQFDSNLESLPLRAFLLNVQGEILSLRSQLDQAYEKLFEASQGLWKTQRVRLQRKAQSYSGAKRQNGFDASSESRSSPPPPTNLSPPLSSRQRASLQFMGFEDFPDQQDLRRRYLELAKKLHPDVINGQDEEFKVLLESYRCLQNR